MLLFKLALTLRLSRQALRDFVLYPYSLKTGSSRSPIDAADGFGSKVTLSTSCAAALNQTITCDDKIRALASSGYEKSLNSTGTVASLCRAECGVSLQNYHDTVATACAGVTAFDTLPNSWRGDAVNDFYKLVCTKDAQSGLYCPDYLEMVYALNPSNSFLEFPNTVLCSPCQLNEFRTKQQSLFGYTEAAETVFKALQLRCGTSFPTTPQPLPVITLPNDATSSPPLNRKCLSGTYYTVQTSDTCKSIATTHSVSEGTLWAINELRPDCSVIFPGKSICLPLPCATYTMTANETCSSVVVSQNILYSTFLGFNPTINSDCTNLNSNGTIVCISNPSGDYVPVLIPESSSPHNDQEYADPSELIDPPGAVAFGSTLKCATWYKVQDADFCSRISLTQSISVALLYSINPSINTDCSNLVPDLYYCVQPIIGWNTTDSGDPVTPTTAIPPPGPTPTGTTPLCRQWHVIVEGDTCQFLQDTLGVSMAQLVAWNPDIRADCGNLLLGEAYCVRGPSLVSSTSVLPSSTSTTRTSTTSTASPPTPTSNPCGKSYTVVSGDWCAKIWEENNLSEAQFRALNPLLDANCDIDIGQVVCVASSSTATTTSTPTPTSSSCSSSYTVASGDWCAKIWEANNLTEAQFRALNPLLNANCDIDIGQVVCLAR